MLFTDKTEDFMGLKDKAWIRGQFSSMLEYQDYLDAQATGKNNFYKFKADNGFHLVEETQEKYDIETAELNQTIIDTCEICDSQCCRTHDVRFTY